MHDLLTELKKHRVLIIFRGQEPQQCADIAETLYEAGMRLFEVTLNSADPYAGITAVRDRVGQDAMVGAGTVLTTDEVDRAAAAGAQFMVSPDVDVDVIEHTKALGLSSVPGALTPTEVRRAVRAGADVVKIFPIRSVGADHVRQLRGPLPDVSYMGTGGVDIALARDCIEAGCTGIGVGVHLLGDPSDPDTLVAGARRLAEAVGTPLRTTV
ncbi:2-dehydro-3-deoxyphosphogluconate aldolase/(4S)-4-hydroxy-2-oxoglutarate aldolase [Nocardioides albertanoniae]|uniref:2-dehydro-3-deoxyphosphogluconate aldolase/(4S)-4-hydroxy-2-oxoglutarate aldolase n=1 Tax=Nocardioides albertanoniae TaxID=1175486 RepID=A0A543A1D7_9ACTN|nr:bifunctional 4-hydroxy-2-oxoglutarate aldolase/2-dehydro-3-deoxy-phosphogluconate aldolase [Nocardioides albertanoniae]TQL66399.1 2-dehydro-3-deoxyphosphogluconate aldolase/(4S)-4-hydroxy-2-oxoglutarate aldolase [Nocardioides albertanoniae]